MAEGVPAVPSIRLSAISACRSKLFSRVFFVGCGTVPDSATVAEWSHRVCRVIKNAKFDAVYESLRVTVGTPFDGEAAEKLSWRLAGNADKLRQGQAVLPWQIQRGDEWSPVRIERAVPRKTKTGIVGTTFHMTVLAGSACSEPLTVFWSNKAAAAVARRVGFTRRTGSFPFHCPTELVGMHMFVLLSPAYSFNRPGFREVTCSAGLVSQNRENVLKQRQRIKPCPQKFVHPCFRCAVGMDACAAATHPTTYLEGECPKCGRSSFFDSYRDNVVCILCDTAKRLAGAR